MKRTIFKTIVALFFTIPALGSPLAEVTPSTDETSPANESSVETPSNNSSTFCFTLFQPATCRAVYGGEAYIADGTNECVAIRNLVKEVNGRYLWFVEVHAADLQELSCAPNE